MADALHPHHVSLCLLLRAYLDPGTQNLQSYLTPDGYQQLGDFLLREVKSAASISVPSLTQLVGQIQTELGDTDAADVAVDLLTDQLEGIKWPDDLLNLFADLGQMLRKDVPPGELQTIADQSSAMGLFLRRCNVTFARLPFEAVCKLFTDIQAYLEEAQQGGPVEQGMVPVMREPAALDAFVNLELQQVQQMVGRVPAAATAATLAELQALAPELQRAHLLRHSHALHHGDFLASLDALHQYFDYAGAAGAAQREGGGGAGAGAGRAEDKAGRFQSALLSLGSTHSHFGHIEEAMVALNETVRIAQQNADGAALTHALAALCRILSEASPAAAASLTEDAGLHRSAAHSKYHVQLLRLLRRCLKRSRELQFPHLAAFARVALARFSMLYRIEPSRALRDAAELDTGTSSVRESRQALQETQTLHCATALAAAVPAGPSLYPPGGAQPGATGVPRPGVGDLFTLHSGVFGPTMRGGFGAAADAVEQMSGSAHLLRSAAWQLAGSHTLACTHALIQLVCYRGAAKAEDQCLAFAQLATTAYHRQGAAAAKQVLAVADQEFPFVNDVRLTAARLSIAHDCALQRRDVRQAEHLAGQVAGLAAPLDTTLLDIRMEAEERSIRTMLAAGRLDDAAEAAARLFGGCTDAGLQVQAVRLLLLMGHIRQEAGAPLAALPYVLSCLLHASNLQLDLLAAEATTTLAELWVALGPQHAPRAAAQLERILPLVAGQAGLALQGRAQLALATCWLSNATADELCSDPERVLQPLRRAGQCFEALQDWGRAAAAHHLTAVVCDTVNNTAERNSAAAAYQRACSLAAECVPAP